MPSRPASTLRRSTSRSTAACCASPASAPPSLPEQRDGVNVYAHERGTGRFTRAVALPDDVDPAHVKANYRDGVLLISVARRESAQPKRITVQ